MMARRPHWQGIIVHHTGALDGDRLELDSIRRYHVQGRGWQDIGYGYLIERVGPSYIAVQGRPLYQEGSHSKGQNHTHIGVAFAGDFSSHRPPAEQLRVGARLIAGLCYALEIPVEAIETHRDHHPTECPGSAFPIDELRAMARSLLS